MNRGEILSAAAVLIGGPVRVRVNTDMRRRLKVPDVQTVEEAEQVIANLQSKRDALIARGDELARKGAAIAFTAIVDGDAKARATLDKIGRETSEQSSELASIRQLGGIHNNSSGVFAWDTTTKSAAI
jgi:hypothetical protein